MDGDFMHRFIFKLSTIQQSSHFFKNFLLYFCHFSVTYQALLHLF